MDERVKDVLARLGLSTAPTGVAGGAFEAAHGALLQSLNPATGSVLGEVCAATVEDAAGVLVRAQQRFVSWRMVPAPQRARLVATLGDLFRRHKEDLGLLISLEAGKIRSEGLGEVQEMVDICEFAVGLSRQLHGLTMPSERPRHRMMEQWHPLGPVAIITAFNFPMAVWAWNAALAAVCGDVCIWKPSPRTPWCSVAVQHLCNVAMAQHGCPGVLSLALGDVDVGAWMAQQRGFPLVSFTGSVAAGRTVATQVAARLGKSLLELGGNNAIVVMPDADLDLAVRAIAFGAVGTAGQRCTSTRRLLVHQDVMEPLLARLKKAYASITPGDPLVNTTLLGPLIGPRAVQAFQAAVAAAQQQGAVLVHGGKRLERPGFFVEPTLLRIPRGVVAPITLEETFAPILYAFEVASLEEALQLHNAVPQGLSSAIFTHDMRHAEHFLSAQGSDCGIANVNIGTSGAEIGGAFGGEKDTGGGRESGSDAWKTYMRRQTCTVNWGGELPLAQGVQFL
jgi:aldehyde dehydrogenase (NAD+)